MEINIIIGASSNLSLQLKDVLKNSHLIGSTTIKNEFEKIKWNDYKTVNFIFNQFQQSTKLYDLDDAEGYIYRAISTTAICLDFIKNEKINVNKIIYTSSSSVYGDNPSCSENDKLIPLSLHASLKVSNEKLIELFCIERNIDLTIARIFNMYGGNDNFSVISKIINAYKNNTVLTLVNNGMSIRDYIHIDDVTAIYERLLDLKGISKLNVGSGNGTSLLYLLNNLKDAGIEIKTDNIVRNELKVSISNNSLLLNILKVNKFQKVEDYLLEQIKGK